MVKKALSIAGFDGSGGAGIQADLKTFSALGCYGMSVLTALPVQNTTGVKATYPIPLAAIEKQLMVTVEDIMPDVIKIGMLFNTEVIKIVAQFIQQYCPDTPIVLDPVMVAKSGDALLETTAIETLRTDLIPLATLITPNLPEAFCLVDRTVHCVDDLKTVAHELLTLNPQAVLLKGGHLASDYAYDYFVDQRDAAELLIEKRIATTNTHGTGCTISAAIAAFLAHDLSLLESCQQAKRYCFRALSHADELNLGQGSGPVHHFYHLWENIDIDKNP